MSIVIMLDSSASITKAIAKKYSIDILTYNLKFSDNIIYRDFIEIKKHSDLINAIHANNSLPVFGLMEKEKIRNLFRKHIENGNDILYICIGDKLSNSYKRISKVAEEFNQNNIQVIDSMNVGIGQTLLAIAAREYINHGYGLKQVAKYINRIKIDIKSYYCIGNPNYLYSQNRCEDIAHNYLDYYHKIPVAEIKKGQIFLTFSAKENEVALQILKNAIMDNHKYLADFPIMISYCGDREISTKLKSYIYKNFRKDVIIVETSTIVYINSGINTIGLSFLINK